MVASLAIAVLAATASAQAPGFKRVELQRRDLSIKDREAIVARGEFQPGATVAKHTHPGEELAYVLEGELTVELEGKPPVTVKAGETFFVPAGTVHSGKNTSKGATIVLSTYILEKGKPIMTPVK
jgi:quercetin dioxygenase-like cupin family protein